MMVPMMSIDSIRPNAVDSSNCATDNNKPSNENCQFRYVLEYIYRRALSELADDDAARDFVADDDRFDADGDDDGGDASPSALIIERERGAMTDAERPSAVARRCGDVDVDVDVDDVDSGCVAI
jgi:hypothetical protein